jgi:hypothetical protein
MASYRLITRGWQPGMFVDVFLAAHQEAARQAGLPPNNAPRVGANSADATGKLDCTIATVDPLLLHGQRLDPRDPPWIQAMASPSDRINP